MTIGSSAGSFGADPISPILHIRTSDGAYGDYFHLQHKTSPAGRADLRANPATLAKLASVQHRLTKQNSGIRISMSQALAFCINSAS